MLKYTVQEVIWHKSDGRRKGGGINRPTGLYNAHITEPDGSIVITIEKDRDQALVEYRAKLITETLNRMADEEAEILSKDVDAA